MGERVEWSQLPKELWPEIGKHLNTAIDVLRFRSICKSWRSSIPLPPSHTLSLFPPQIIIYLSRYCLTQTKIYRLDFDSSSEDPSISKGWLIKVGESKSTPLRLLDPFTNYRVSHSRRRHAYGTSPKVLNIMNFRIVELIEAYSLNYRCELSSGDEDGETEDSDGEFMPAFDVRKAVLFPSFSSKEVEDRGVFTLYKNGKLGVSKIEDENWTFLDDGNLHYDDIIVHKGQLYVVDKWGTILWINTSSLKLVQFSPPLCGFGKKKHLVECSGSLYVVDMYIEGEPDNPMGMYCEVIDIKVYKLDEEWGKWLHIKDLGDSLFVLGKDCNFSLSAEDYHGCEGNCIYFSCNGTASVFSLESSKFKTPNLFWPCPTLFQPKSNLQV